MKEIWKDIIGYEGLYQVSNMGNIYSLPRKGKGGHSGKLLVQIKTNGGYYGVNLCYGGKCKFIQTHRLVAQSFIGLDLKEKKGMGPIGTCVCHKNDIPTDNRLENLFLGTQKDNIKDCIDKKRFHKNMKGKFGYKHHNSKKVKQYTLDGKLLKIWDSIRDVERNLKIDNSSITSCCKGKMKTAGKFIWKYL